MSEEEFTTNVSSIVIKKSEKPHTLHNLSTRYWDGILYHQAQFERGKLVI